MSALEQLSDIGINPITATSLMRRLGISSDELSLPEVFSRFQDVAKYFSGFENADYVISKVTWRKTDDPLQKLYEFVGIQKKREFLEKQLSEIDGEINLIQSVPDTELKMMELNNKKEDVNIQLLQTISEAKLYER